MFENDRGCEKPGPAVRRKMVKTSATTVKGRAANVTRNREKGHY
jgi:hypothetical protein